MKTLWQTLLVTGVTLALDGVTKAWAEKVLALHDPLPRGTYRTVIPLNGATSQ